jgi:phage/plasmid primase-like uncharacterized protein/phage/plasmid-associated DNA primase
LQSLNEFLDAHNFHIQPEFDGKVQRFDRGGKHNNGWFVGRKWTLGNKDFILAKVGDWSTGENFDWKSDQGYSPEELKEAQKLIREAAIKDDEEKLKIQNAVATQAQAMWDKAIDRGTTGYMEQKGIEKLLLARIDSERPDNLLVPLRDTEGKLWNLQKILSKKLPPNNINKIFLEGGRIKGLFGTFGEIHQKGRIFICEGYATGYSIHVATGHAVCCAFNASNLLHVAKVLREKYPESQIAVCGDDDQWTRNGKGDLHNVGREKATYAAASIQANKLYPLFKNLKDRPTDFNDLHRLEGLQAVKEQIINAPAKTELEPVCDYSEKGHPKKPSESKIVNTLLKHFEGNLIQQDGELFKFINTHWQHQGEEEIRRIKNLLMMLSGDTLKSAEVESAFKQFILKTPISPRNMFQPNPFFANFTNGTLIISKTPGAPSYRREFREHSYADYITNVIPLKYEPEKCEINTDFLAGVDRLFKNDPDKDGKIKALKELFGACLTPLFPRIFLLVGPPGSGKSTVAILASKLVSDDNLSMVEPHEFRGFHMESMLGKLVNISTDIKTNEPIDDAMMKKIEDRVPVRIDRKFKTPVRAWLPAIHIFGANKLPPNYEGDSRAFTRRTTIIEFESFKAEGRFNRNFAQEVFDANPQGVLNFAIEGLLMLLESGGHFTNPDSGTARLEDWQMEHDPVGQFFKELFNNEIEGQSKLEPGTEFTIERKILWESFKNWHEESFSRYPRFSKHKFYSLVQVQFCKVITLDGVRKFRGVKIRESASSNF